MLLPWSCWALLLLCTTASLFGWLGLSTLQEEVRTPPGVHLEVTPRDEQPQDEASLRVPSPPDSSAHQEPVQDETLSSSEQHRLAQLVEDITQRMGRMSIRAAPGQQVVLSNDEQQRAQDASSKREGNLDLLLTEQRRSEELMEKVQKLKESLVLMLAAVKDAQNQMENHLQHVHSTLNPRQSSSVISTCILYVSYFMLLVSLLVPTLPRVIILLLFLISSALSGVLSIAELSSLLALALAGQWLVAVYSGGAVQAPWLLLLQEEPHHWLNYTPNRQCGMKLLQEELDTVEMSCLQEPSPEQPSAMAGDLPSTAGHTSPPHGGWRTKLSSRREMLEVSVGTGKHWEPKPCSPSNLSSAVRSLLSPRSLCQGLTRAGQRCQKKAIPGQDFCHVHAIG
ncbi:protein brambleberry-like isoform X2 [Pezoporus occidentalis]|uniref:protein brambleberry-like isoform X2 n=1 Tax=Pezoporus occidentalis TaxID=407982 RepID=UPI002F906DEB